MYEVRVFDGNRQLKEVISPERIALEFQKKYLGCNLGGYLTRRRITQRKYEVMHKEHLRAYRKQYRQDNKERIAAQKKEYRLLHKEEEKIKRKARDEKRK